MAAARRELGQLTVEEYAKQRRMTDYSTGWHVDNSISVHIVPRRGSRKLNSVTPIVVERYMEKHGTTKDGYPLRGPGGYFIEGMERRRVRRLFADLPPEEGVGMYGFRHYFASNALGNGIPITDVAEWMGHKSIEETYRTYRHLMPGSITKAARILGTGIWQAA
ncbi:tyrosine-type recombinase/integrase [Streptomyces sp. NPDC012756]|uniref:tyrosine-type recombinase/integrase n=1 Tax=Streptomyces sp. NPDC012756 TaxID=3364847 RepID=UPI0026ACF8FC